ncbi:hypothetical protein BDN71DRAFT_1588954 [Pleurotus eryngii]|uniref:Uncharacterized protein n=1 Tax=Pleurotus eryngii TaxID=5323 RepID=A0A9P6DGA3_PLEER|nr:hypothetical protein BDN71DRAFT_1588954 [Pleurotus eryngii]
MLLPFDLSSPSLSLYSIPAAWFCAFYPNTLKFFIIDKTVGYDNTNPRGNLARTKGNDKFKPGVVEKIHRMEGAHQNGNEAFPLWAAAIITGNLVGLEHRTLNICSIAYIGLRLLYNYIYISHNSFMKGSARSVVFFTALRILILRTSALYNNDRRVKYALSSLIILMSINGGVQWYLSTFTGPPGPSVNRTIVENSAFHPGCYIPYGHRQYIEIASEWGLLLIFDATVFVMTIRKTLPLVRNECSGNSNLWVALLRDGSIYFALLSISNLANICVLLSAPVSLRCSMTPKQNLLRLLQPYLKPLFPIFVNILSITAISRLMLNLRDPFLRNPQVTPKQVTPEAGLQAVIEIVRAKDDLEAGTSSEPKKNKGSRYHQGHQIIPARSRPYQPPEV